MHHGSNPGHTYSTRSTRAQSGAVLPAGQTLSDTLSAIEHQAQLEAAADAGSHSEASDSFIDCEVSVSPRETTHSNPLFEPEQQYCFADMDTEVKYLGPKYEGSKGPAFYEYRQAALTYLLKEYGRFTRMGLSPTMVVSFTYESLLSTVGHGSTADTFLRELQLKFEDIMSVVAANYYPKLEPLDELKRLCLEDNYGVPRYEQLFTQKLNPLELALADLTARGWVKAVAELAALPAAPVVAAAAAGAPAAAPAAREKLIKGKAYTPVVFYIELILVLLEIKFGTVDAELEQQYKLLKQGDMTLDKLAHTVNRWQQALSHLPEYTKGAAAVHFLQALKDQDAAKAAQQAFMTMPNVEHTVERAKSLVEKFQEQRASIQRNEAERQVAQSIQDGGKGKKASSPSTDTSNMSGAEVAKQMRLLALQQKHPADHPLSPCTLHGSSHLNWECRTKKAQLAKQAQQHQPRASSSQSFQSQNMYAGAGAYASGYMPDYPQTGHMPDFNLAVAGAAPAGSPAGRQQQLQWNSGKQQQRQQYGNPSAAPARPEGTPGRQPCDCGGAHRPDDCYYKHPDRALNRNPYWRASPRAPAAAIENLRHACARLRIPVEQLLLQPFRLPAAAQPAAAALPADNALPAADSPNNNEFPGWFVAGSLTAADAPASAMTRSRQVVSFLPDADITPKPVRQATKAPDSKPANVADTVQVNISLTVPSGEVGSVLKLIGLSKVSSNASTSSTEPGSAASASSTGAASPTDYASVEEQREMDMIDVIYEQLSRTAGTTAVKPSPVVASASSECGSLVDKLCAAALPELQGPAFKDRLFEQIVAQGIAQSGRNISQLYADMLLNKGNCTMREFCSNHPANGVSLQTRDGRIALIPRAMEDSGCNPSIISEACAKSLGLAMRDRRPDEYPHIQNIEGEGASKLKKVTEPVTFILARGTPNEVSLQAKDGLMVMEGDAAAAMYDVVLGTDLLLEVAGTTCPLTSAFHYLVRAKDGGFKWANLPVRIGRGSISGLNPKPSMGFICAAVSQGTTAAPAADQSQQPQPSAKAGNASGPKAKDKAKAKAASGNQMVKTVDAALGAGPSSGASATLPVYRPFQWLVLTLAWLMWLPVALPLLCFGSSVQHWLYQQVSAFGALLQGATVWRCTTYYRLGRAHRSVKGATIYLATSKFGSGRKPRIAHVFRSTWLSWRVALTFPLRAFVLLVVILAFCTASTTAVRLESDLRGTACTNVLHHPGIRNTLPYHPGQVLAWSVTNELAGHTFRGCWFQRSSPTA